MTPTVTPAHAPTHLQRQIEHFAETISSPIAGVARKLQDAARALQTRCGTMGRVHVIFESLPGVSPDAARPPDSVALSVLFSPTISFDKPTGVQGRAHLAEALRRFADESETNAVGGAQQRMDVMHVGLQQQRLHPPVKTKEVLKWYPGGRAGINKKVWMTERMHVKTDTMARFKHLNRKQTEGVYQGLFAKMFRIMKTRVPGERGPLKYARFTPPWLRKHIITGKTTIILDSDTMPELRQQRNRMGERRLKALMSAFYENEALAKSIIDVLLQEVVTFQPSTSGLPHPAQGQPHMLPQTNAPQPGSMPASSVHVAHVQPSAPAPAQAFTPTPKSARTLAPAPSVPRTQPPVVPSMCTSGPASGLIPVPVLPRNARTAHRPVLQKSTPTQVVLPKPSSEHARVAPPTTAQPIAPRSQSSVVFSRYRGSTSSPDCGAAQTQEMSRLPSVSVMREQQASTEPLQEGSRQESIPETPALPT